jgi:predicted RNase H-like nuclease (RuvC/YqgF family)
MQWSIVGTFVGTIAVALIGYVVAVRKASGKISSSEASDLWEESRAMRADYAVRLQRCDERIAQMETRQSTLEAANDALGDENRALRRRIFELEGAS